MHSTCAWTANRAFLIRKFTVEGPNILLHAGTEVIGYDPRIRSIRSWIFDAHGDFGENAWIRAGNRWLVRFPGTLANGSQAAAMRTCWHSSTHRP